MNLTTKQKETLAIVFNSAFFDWSQKLEKCDADNSSEEYFNAVNDIYSDICDLHKALNDKIIVQ